MEDGAFHIGVGAASLLAGIMWETNGASFTFLTGAAFSTIALAGLLIWQIRAI